MAKIMLPRGSPCLGGKQIKPLPERGKLHVLERGSFSSGKCIDAYISERGIIAILPSVIKRVLKNPLICVGLKKASTPSALRWCEWVL